jgi:hypothetical protein
VSILVFWSSNANIPLCEAFMIELCESFVDVSRILEQARYGSQSSSSPGPLFYDPMIQGTSTLCFNYILFVLADQLGIIRNSDRDFP